MNLKWGSDKIDWWLIIGLEKQRTKLMFVLSESLIKNSLFRLRKHLLCSTTGSSSSPSVLNDYPGIRQQPFSQEKECIIIDDTGIKNDFNVLLDWQCHFDQPLCALTVVKIINILIAIIVVILSPSQVPRLTCLWVWVGEPDILNDDHILQIGWRRGRVRMWGGGDLARRVTGGENFFLENSHLFK